MKKRVRHCPACNAKLKDGQHFCNTNCLERFCEQAIEEENLKGDPTFDQVEDLEHFSVACTRF